MKLFWNQATGLGGDVVKRLFLFLALVTISFRRVKIFEQFGKVLSVKTCM